MQMTVQDYLNLKNGTDVRGVALNGVEGEALTLTADAVENIAKAFCVWLISRTGKTRVRVAIGYDSRLTSPRLCRAAVRGVVGTGHTAIITGLSTTPSMFALLKDEAWMKEGCQGSIMITASHLPFNRNGLKFFSANGGLESEDVTEILTLAASYRFAEGIKGEKIENAYLDEYASSLVEKVRQATQESRPLLGKHILVDAGNGAGGFFAKKVLQPLGSIVDGSQFLEPNGHFPNHIPNPESKVAMDSICEKVKEMNADLGIAFDTDVDRAAIVDKNGVAINRNKLIALISAILLEEKSGAIIVTDSITSDGLTQFIEEKGGVHHRFKRGYKNVINEAKKLNAKGEYAPLAIETSGHAAFADNYFLDDGAYLVVQLLIAMAKAAKNGKSLNDYIENFENPEEEMEIRLPFDKNCDFKALGAKILKDYENYASTLPFASPAKTNYEGVRINFEENYGAGWALMRLSLHDPVLPINVESEEEGGALKILKNIYYFLKEYKGIQLSPLKKAIEKERARRIHVLKKAIANQELSFR